MFYRGMDEMEVRAMGLEFVADQSGEDYDFYRYDLGDGYWLEIYVDEGRVVDLVRCSDF